MAECDGPAPVWQASAMALLDCVGGRAEERLNWGWICPGTPSRQPGADQQIELRPQDGEHVGLRPLSLRLLRALCSIPEDWREARLGQRAARDPCWRPWLRIGVRGSFGEDSRSAGLLGPRPRRRPTRSPCGAADRPLDRAPERGSVAVPEAVSRQIRPLGRRRRCAPASGHISVRRRRAGLARCGAAPHLPMPAGASVFINPRAVFLMLVTAPQLPRSLGGGAPDVLLCPEAWGCCGLPGGGLSAQCPATVV
ncbi:hypothetical protein NDU88_006019 [Pleurodeles waltl]|uniref:Uncharacterized protein n=1 Tax=Pleurodeles waltl TaxID=8319 RepID=A0AAV7TYW0_PLEWA|nr:hypothetical protein NDU88_006019 [Pleurodeles waltl]